MKTCLKTDTVERYIKKSFIICIIDFQKDIPSDQQLHLAALQGNLEDLRNVLETGKVHVDCKDKVGVCVCV